MNSDDDYEEFEEDDISEDLEESDNEEEPIEALERDFEDNDLSLIHANENDYINVLNMEEYLDSPDKKTPNRITKYEFTKVIGLRTTQLSNGMPALIEVGNEYDLYNIAIMEYKADKIPFIIKRPLPGEELFEYWRLSDLKKNVSVNC